MIRALVLAALASPLVACASEPPGSSSGAAGWVWNGAAPIAFAPAADASAAVPVPPRAQEVTTDEGVCRFTANDGDGTASLACFDAKGARVWGYDEADARARGASIAARGRFLYVAWFPLDASGCEVVAYDAKSGVVAWRTPLIGLGPTTATSNAVELRVVTNRLRVLGWESGGRYIEDVDPDTGATIASSRVEHDRVLANAVPAPAAPGRPPQPGRAERVAFKFDGKSSPRRVRLGGLTTASDLRCDVSLEQAGERLHFACTRDGARVWGYDLADFFVPGAAITANVDAVFVVTYCAISSGAVVTAFDADRGRLLWTRRLEALGDVAHSEYYNDLDVRAEDGLVIVSGWEAYGKYVEVLDAKTGEDLGNRKEP